MIVYNILTMGRDVALSYLDKVIAFFDSLPVWAKLVALVGSALLSVMAVNLQSNSKPDSDGIMTVWRLFRYTGCLLISWCVLRNYPLESLTEIKLWPIVTGLIILAILFLWLLLSGHIWRIIQLILNLAGFLMLGILFGMMGKPILGIILFVVSVILAFVVSWIQDVLCWVKGEDIQKKTQNKNETTAPEPEEKPEVSSTPATSAATVSKPITAEEKTTAKKEQKHEAEVSQKTKAAPVPSPESEEANALREQLARQQAEMDALKSQLTALQSAVHTKESDPETPKSNPEATPTNAKESEKEKDPFSKGYDAEKKGDFAEALKQYKIAVSQGSGAAAWNLANLYANGNGVQRDERESFRWRVRGADLGDATCMGVVANYFHNGINGAEVDNEKALFYAKKAKEQKPSASLDKLILEIEQTIAFDAGNKAHKAGNDEEALRQFMIGAEKGDATCAWNLGVLYAIGKGTAKDKAEGFKWQVRSAELGNTKAMCSVAKDYYRGTSGAKQDLEKALFWAKKANDSGQLSHDEYMANLILIYQIEQGMGAYYFNSGLDAFESRNYTEAMRLFLLAAENGSADGASNVAYMYENKLGVQEDKNAIFRWRMCSAELGHVRSMFLLAENYLYGGNGVKKDLEKAYFWLEKGCAARDESTNLSGMQIDRLRREIEKGLSNSLYKKAYETYYKVKNPYEGGLLFSDAIQAGSAVAAWTLAEICSDPNEVWKDDKKSQLARTYAAKLGYPNALYYMAKSYFNGENGVDKDLDKALEYATMALDSPELAKEKKKKEMKEIITVCKNRKRS